MKQQKITIHWILGGALLLIGIFVVIIFILIRSQGAAPGTSLSVNNEAPTVDEVKLCSGSGDPGCTHITTGVGLTLTSGTTTEFSIAGTLSDANGFSDIVSFFGEFRKDDAASFAGAPCVDDTDVCYAKTFGGGGCTLTATSATAGTFECVINIEYYAQATSADAVVLEGGDPTGYWIVRGYAEDTTGQNGLLENTTEINTLRALETDEGNACATIAYGSLANGSATSDSSLSGTDCVLENAGNVDTDVSESGTNMSCTFGSVAIANQRVNVASGTYASMASGGTDLTVSAQNVNVALDKTSSTTKSTDSLFHAISVPSTGASGACTGTNTILAISEVI